MTGGPAKCTTVPVKINTTPGNLVADTVNETAGAQVKQLVNADEIDEAIIQIAKALIIRIISSSKGLFSDDGDVDTSFRTAAQTGKPTALITRIDQGIAAADAGLQKIAQEIAAIDAELAPLKAACAAGLPTCDAAMQQQISALEKKRADFEAQAARTQSLKSQLESLKAQYEAETDLTALPAIAQQATAALAALDAELASLGISTGSGGSGGGGSGGSGGGGGFTGRPGATVHQLNGASISAAEADLLAGKQVDLVMTDWNNIQAFKSNLGLPSSPGMRDSAWQYVISRSVCCPGAPIPGSDAEMIALNNAMGGKLVQETDQRVVSYANSIVGLLNKYPGLNVQIVVGSDNDNTEVQYRDTLLKNVFAGFSGRVN
jgi:hypothetical protein